MAVPEGYKPLFRSSPTIDITVGESRVVRASAVFLVGGALAEA